MYFIFINTIFTIVFIIHNKRFVFKFQKAHFTFVIFIKIANISFGELISWSQNIFSLFIFNVMRHLLSGKIHLLVKSILLKNVLHSCCISQCHISYLNLTHIRGKIKNSVNTIKN